MGLLHKDDAKPLLYGCALAAFQAGMDLKGCMGAVIDAHDYMLRAQQEDGKLVGLIEKSVKAAEKLL